jgi:hypothetical protein
LSIASLLPLLLPLLPPLLLLLLLFWQPKGHRLLEIEFPPLPTDVMDSESCSAYDVSQANVALAVDLAKKFVLNDEMKVSIMMPDSEEARRAAEDQGAGEEPFPGVTINSLTLNAMENAQGGCFLRLV